MDSTNTEIDLEEIMSESLKDVQEISEESYQYFVSLSKDRLLKRITTSIAREIAKELLQKTGIEVEE